MTERQEVLSPLPSLDPIPFPADTRALTPAQVRDLDRYAIEKVGIPGAVLMENAAGALARLAHHLLPADGRLLFLCGPGNNGGDGMAAHRLLAPRGELLLLGDPDRLRGDAALQWRILGRSGIPATATLEEKEILRLLTGLGADDLVVDALFGTGLDRPVKGLFAGVIEEINRCPATVLATDIPSGLHGESGEILGSAVTADHTITFAAPKVGFFRARGPECCGHLHLARIGLPPGPLRDFPGRDRRPAEE